MVNIIFTVKDENVFCEVKNINNEDCDRFWLTGNSDFLSSELSDQRKPWRLNELCYFENEVYFYFYIKYISIIEKLFERYRVNEIVFKGSHEIFDFIKGYCLTKNEARFNKNDFILKYYFNIFKSFFNLFLSNVYLTIILIFGLKNTRFKVNNTKNIGFALIHSKTSFNNIFSLYDNKIRYYYDSITLKDTPKGTHVDSFFSVLSYKEKLFFVVKLFFKSFLELKNNWVSIRKMLGKYNSSFPLLFISKRVSHFLLLKECYGKIFKNSRASEFYSGERESRYGILAMHLRKEKIRAIAIPHGMAYSFDFPLGIFGDVYYATSIPEKKFLEKLYVEKRVLFDEDVLKKMFCVKNQDRSKNKRIVFFTEPRRLEVNIKIFNFLLEEFDNILIKLHPADSKENYLMFKNIKYIEDFNESISNNICLARKSTILIEALYNGSESIGVLVDENDKFDFNNTFPSLKDHRIKKVETFNELKKILNNNVKK